MITNFALMLFSTALAATPCAGLKSISIPNTAITMAELVPAGVFTPPAAPRGQAPAAPAAPAVGAPQRGGGGGRGQGGGAPAPAVITVPAFCRVTATLTPTTDSSIDMEVWMPAENWNGKFQFVGGGGWAGVISYPALATALQEGYATASTDTGHKGGNANFAIGHPEKVVDFAYRAVHESTVKAKTIMTTFYDRGPRLSYWNGCSTGGRQGLMEAQRYPEDFDAIVAGAPANYQTHLHAWDLGVAVPVLNNPASAVSTAKATALSKAVVAACDAKDGVKDGLLNDPRSCKVSGKALDFDLSTMLCKAGDADSCLTAPQLEAVKRMYAPAMTKSGQLVFPGKEPGSETGWNVIAASQAPPGVSLGSFQVAYDNLQWDWKSYDLDRDLKIVDEKVGTIINAVNPDLSAFKAHGGKLILYHGWNDTAISPENTVNYYNSVLAKMGQKQDNFVRLFMAPGMQHCGNGPGPNQINYMGALERWRESGIAPDQLLANHVTNNRVDMARPLCPYPQVATYKGVGSTNDAVNFVCKAPQANAN